MGDTEVPSAYPAKGGSANRLRPHGPRPVAATCTHHHHARKPLHFMTSSR